MSKAAMTALPYTAAFKPTSLPGCSFWIDAADTSSQSMILSGNNVTTWKDKSGNGVILTTNGTPTYNSSQYGAGLGGVVFNAGPYFQNTSFSLNLANRSIFIVANGTGGNEGILALTYTTVDYNNVGSLVYCDGGNKVVVLTENYPTGPNATYTSPTAPIMTSDSSTSSNISFWGNGNIQGTYTFSPTTSTGIIIGARNDGGGVLVNKPLTGSINEIIIYSPALTTAQRQQVEGYLAAKWGIQSSLPSFTTPTSISGCGIWLDAADASSSSMTFSSGSTLSAWKDKSGNGATFTVTGTPTLSQYNGRTAIYLNGSSYFINTTLSCPVGNHTFFVVVQTSQQGNQGILSFNTVASGLTDYNSPNTIIFCTGSPINYAINYANGGYYQGSSALPSTGFIEYSIYCDTITSSPGTGNFWVNGTNVYSASSSVTFTNSTGLVIGARANGGAITLPLTGYMSEIIVYTTALTTTQRQQVDGYLAWKWGLQSSLPTNHPYYAVSPTHPYATTAPTGPNALGITRAPAVAALVPTPKQATTALSYYATFLPTSIAGCAMWLDAADSSSFTFSSGTTISQWKDKSGSANNFTVTTGTTTRITDGGVNVVNFPSGGSTMTSSSSITLTTNHSVFIVTKLISNTFGFGYLLSCPALKPSDNAQGVSGDYSIRYNPSFITPSTGNGGDIFYNNTGGYYANGTLSGVPTATSYHMLNGRFSQGGTTQIALSFGGVYGRYFVGTVAEVIIFSQVLTTTQRQSVEGYLAWKWGLQASLPQFVPTSVGGTQLWLDGADITTQTFSGSNITAWNDKSGNGYHMNQPALAGIITQTAAYPTAGTAINGKSTVNFSPQAGLKQSNNLNGVRNLYWVGRISNSGGSGYYFLFGQNTYYDWHANEYSPSNRMLWDLYTSAELRNSTASLYTLDANAAVNTTFGNIYYPSNSSISILSVSGITGSSTLYQGICYDRSYHVGWCGDLAEVLVYSTALTNEQHQQVEGYLAWKWGMQAQLPNTHPYYSAAPTGHPYASTAPVGASLRAPAVAALVPTPTKAFTAIKKPIASLTLTNSGSTDSYIASYLSNGYVNSIARQAGTGADVGNGIATDTNGNIIITGHYSSNPFTLYTTAGSAFSTTLVNSGQTAFVAQYSSSGAVNWVARFSGSSVGLFCKTDSSNNIYVFGYFTSAPLTAYSSSGTAFGTTISTLYYFLVKYNSSGIIQWIANIGGTGQTNQNSLTCDTNGNVIVTCTGSGITPRNSDGTSYTGSGIVGAYRVNGFIVYYNTSGTIQWVATFAGGSRFWNQAISVDSSGNVYCSGYSLGGFAQPYNASGTGMFTVAGASGQNGYIVKYTSAGSNVSGTAYGGSGVTAAPLSQVTDSNADTTIVGTFTGTTFIAYSNNSTSQPFSNTLSNPGTTCGFIVKYNSSFVVQWTANIQAATGVVTPTGVTCDSLNNIYVSVYTTGNVTIYSSNGSAATTITNTGTNTSFIVKFSSAGLFIWVARQSGGASTSQYLYGIVTDSIGNPYAVGAYTSAAGFVYSTGF